VGSPLRQSNSRRNRYALVRNARSRGEPPERLLLIGRSDEGRILTLVVERTLDPTTWLVVTGWSSTDRERRIQDA